MEKEAKHPILKHKSSVGQKAADALTKITGSWTFIIIFLVFLTAWIMSGGYFILRLIEKNLNDPYPFVFLNLILGIINAVLAPIILMSQNRGNQIQRLKMEHDFEINKKSEREISEIKKQLDRIERKLK